MSAAGPSPLFRLGSFSYPYNDNQDVRYIVYGRPAYIPRNRDFTAYLRTAQDLFIRHVHNRLTEGKTFFKRESISIGRKGRPAHHIYQPQVGFQEMPLDTVGVIAHFLEDITWMNKIYNGLMGSLVLERIFYQTARNKVIKDPIYQQNIEAINNGLKELKCSSYQTGPDKLKNWWKQCKDAILYNNTEPNNFEILNIDLFKNTNSLNIYDKNEILFTFSILTDAINNSESANSVPSDDIETLIISIAIEGNNITRENTLTFSVPINETEENLIARITIELERTMSRFTTEYKEQWLENEDPTLDLENPEYREYAGDPTLAYEQPPPQDDAAAVMVKNKVHLQWKTRAKQAFTALQLTAFNTSLTADDNLPKDFRYDMKIPEKIQYHVIIQQAWINMINARTWAQRFERNMFEHYFTQIETSWDLTAADEDPKYFQSQYTQLIDKVTRCFIEPEDREDINLGSIWEVAIRSVQQEGNMLQFLPDKHRDDFHIVLTAVRNAGMSIEFASHACRHNPEIILAALKENGLALEHVDLEYFKNQATASVQTDTSIISSTELPIGHLRLVSDVIRKLSAKRAQNEQLFPYRRTAPLFLTLTGVEIDVTHQNTPSSDTILSPSRPDTALLPSDPDLLMIILLTAVKNNGLALQYAGDYCGDLNIVMPALQNNGLALQYATLSIQDYPDAVLTAIDQDGLALQYATPRFRDNPEIVSRAITQNPLAIQYASRSLQERFANATGV